MERQLDQRCFRKKLLQFSFLQQNNSNIYYHTFLKPGSLYEKLKDIMFVSQKKIFQIDNHLYNKVLQSFMKQNQINQFKGLELIQAWMIYQIKIFFNFVMPAQEMLSFVVNIFNEDNISIQKCVQDIAKNQLKQISNKWIEKNKNQIQSFSKKIIQNDFFLRSINKRQQQLEKIIAQYQSNPQLQKKIALQSIDETICQRLSSCNQRNSYQHYIQFLNQAIFFLKTKQEEYCFKVNTSFLKKSILGFLSWSKNLQCIIACPFKLDFNTQPLYFFSALQETIEKLVPRNFEALKDFIKIKLAKINKLGLGSDPAINFNQIVIKTVKSSGIFLLQILETEKQCKRSQPKEYLKKRYDLINNWTHKFNNIFNNIQKMIKTWDFSFNKFQNQVILNEKQRKEIAQNLQNFFKLLVQQCQTFKDSKYFPIKDQQVAKIIHILSFFHKLQTDKLFSSDLRPKEYIKKIIKHLFTFDQHFLRQLNRILNLKNNGMQQIQTNYSQKNCSKIDNLWKKLNSFIQNNKQSRKLLQINIQDYQQIDEDKFQEILKKIADIFRFDNLNKIKKQLMNLIFQQNPYLKFRNDKAKIALNLLKNPQYQDLKQIYIMYNYVQKFHNLRQQNSLNQVLNNQRKQSFSDVFSIIEQQLEDLLKSIKQQALKEQNNNNNKLTQKYLQVFDCFIQYDQILKNGLFQQIKEQKQYQIIVDAVKSMTPCIISNLRKYLDQIIKGRNIGDLDKKTASDLKRYYASLVKAQKCQNFGKLFGIFTKGFKQQINEFLIKSTQDIKFLIKNSFINLSGSIKNLCEMKKQISQIKSFNQIYFQQKLGLTKIEKRINKQIYNLSDLLAQQIKQLFRDPPKLSEIQKIYTLSEYFLQRKGMVKEKIKKLLEFYVKKQIQFSSQKNHLTILENQSNLHKKFNQLKNSQLINKFKESKIFFQSKCNLQIKQLIIKTYKQRQQKILLAQNLIICSEIKNHFQIFIQEAQVLILWEQGFFEYFYQQIVSKKIDEKVVFGQRLGQRLAYYFKNIRHQIQLKVETIFSKDIDAQKVIQLPYFLNIYKNISETNQLKLNKKLQELVSCQLKFFKESFDRSNTDKKIIENKIQMLFDKLPEKIKGVSLTRLSILKKQNSREIEQ